jgi:hypothetical protein
MNEFGSVPNTLHVASMATTLGGCPKIGQPLALTGLSPLVPGLRSARQSRGLTTGLAAGSLRPSRPGIHANNPVFLLASYSPPGINAVLQAVRKRSKRSGASNSSGALRLPAARFVAIVATMFRTKSRGRERRDKRQRFAALSPPEGSGSKASMGGWRGRPGHAAQDAKRGARTQKMHVLFPSCSCLGCHAADYARYRRSAQAYLFSVVPHGVTPQISCRTLLDLSPLRPHLVLFSVPQLV